MMESRARTRLAAVGGGLLLLAASLVLAGPAQEATRTAPRTLVTAHKQIYAFAQDGDWIGWVTGDAGVHVRRLTTRKTWVVGKVNDRGRLSSAVIALAGQRAIWAWNSGGNNDEESLVTGAPGRRPAFVDVIDGDLRGTGGGARFAGVSGDAADLAYGVVVEKCVNRPFGCDVPWTDPLVVTGGGVTLVPKQLSGQRPPAIPGVAPAAIFTVAQGRVAVAPARSPTPSGPWVPRVAEDGPVDVYDLNGGRLMRVYFAGLVRDVALGGHTLAVLQEQPDGSRVIRRFDARNGAYLSGGATVATGATDLAASGSGIVFRVGRAIYMLRKGTPRLVGRASATPIGLSIEGRRIAWAMNLKRRGRIVSFTLPA